MPTPCAAKSNGEVANALRAALTCAPAPLSSASCMILATSCWSALACAERSPSMYSSTPLSCRETGLSAPKISVISFVPVTTPLARFKGMSAASRNILDCTGGGS